MYLCICWIIKCFNVKDTAYFKPTKYTNLDTIKQIIKYTEYEVYFFICSVI